MLPSPPKVTLPDRFPEFFPRLFGLTTYVSAFTDSAKFQSTRLLSRILDMATSGRQRVKVGLWKSSCASFRQPAQENAGLPRTSCVLFVGAMKLVCMIHKYRAYEEFLLIVFDSLRFYSCWHWDFDYEASRMVHIHQLLAFGQPLPSEGSIPDC